MMTPLSYLPARIRSISANGSPIESLDINNKTHSSHLSIVCRAKNGTRIAWSVYKTKKGYPSEAKSDYSQLNLWAKNIQEEIFKTQEQYNLPIFGMYPVDRAQATIPVRIKKHHTFDLVSILEPDLIWNADYKIFYEWFRDQDIMETKEHYKDRSLEAVRQAIYSFMPGFSQLQFKTKPHPGLFVEKKGYGTFGIEQLSGGEQCIFALIGDIARKLAIANPVLENPLEGTGIIFIDEIDLHLHPSWQYTVVEKLKQTFPGCQFILSTHSPCLISHAKRNEITYLEDVNGTIVAQQGLTTYGKDAASLYQDYLTLSTTRPRVVEDQLQEIYQLLDNNLSEAESKLKELQNLVENDTELAKIQLIIDRKRTLGI